MPLHETDNTAKGFKWYTQICITNYAYKLHLLLTFNFHASSIPETMLNFLDSQQYY